jgi:hypothetical protein
MALGVALTLSAALPLLGSAFAQDTPTPPRTPDALREMIKAKMAGRTSTATKGNIRPYDEIITNEAKSKKGLTYLNI